MIRTLRGLSAALVIAVAPLGASAADDPVTHVLAQPNEPVRIDMCSVKGPNSGIMNMQVDLTNVSDKPVTDVQLVFVQRDPFGGNGVGSASFHGSYAAGATVRGLKKSYRTSAAAYAQAACTVGQVVFADGTKWSAGKGFLKDAFPTTSASPAAASSPAP
jgi:hypothetical protein